MLNAILLFGCLATAILGLIVVYSNPKSPVNRSLAGFIFAGFLWASTNLATNIADASHFSELLTVSQLTLIGASLLPAFFLFFIYTYLQKEEVSKKQIVGYSLPSILLLGVTFTDLNIREIDGSLQAGSAYYFLIVYYIICFTHGTRLLMREYSTSTNHIARRQMQFIFMGIVSSVSFGMIFNAVLPIFGYIEASYIGSVSVLFFAFFTSLAIVRYRLLNIRLIVARSVAYVLSIGLLFLCYIIAYTLLMRVMAGENNVSVAVSLLNVVVLALAVLLYQPQKRFFDRITNKIFYQDAYDPQKFLDQLNKTVISNIEIGILLRHSAQVIASNLRVDEVMFMVFEGSENGDVRSIGLAKKAKSRGLVHYLKRGEIPQERLVSVDTIERDYPELHSHMIENNIAVIGQLTPELTIDRPVPAYMLLGAKKSGNPYGRSDLQIIEIIADELVVAIQNALRFEEIQNFSITLQQKVDEATKKLVKTNQKLKELDATKDDFISMASHQLRTPLTSVKGLLSMVVEGDAGKLTPLQQEMLTQAYVSSQRMTYLIADLLNASRLKSGKFAIERSVTNLATLAQQEVAQLVETAKARSLTLTYEIPDAFPDLMLDETKTRQLIMNFIDNAIYYTPSGGAITVKVIDKPKSVELQVVDTGLGVPKADQPRLFTKFYRAKNAQNARPDGTGLGLFMAKKVIIAQGGAIIFKSQEGKGSTFGFSFPKTPELTDLSQQPITTVIKNP